MYRIERDEIGQVNNRVINDQSPSQDLIAAYHNWTSLIFLYVFQNVFMIYLRAYSNLWKSIYCLFIPLNTQVHCYVQTLDVHEFVSLMGN